MPWRIPHQISKGKTNDDDMKDAELLVLANKQGLPNAMSASEVTDKLALRSVRDRL